MRYYTVFHNLLIVNHADELNKEEFLTELGLKTTYLPAIETEDTL